MNASVNVERNSWRLPPDETVQVADPRSKSAQVKEVIDPASKYLFRCCPLPLSVFSFFLNYSDNLFLNYFFFICHFLSCKRSLQSLENVTQYNL